MMNIIKVDQLFSQEEYEWTNYSNPCIFNNYVPNIALDLGDAIFEELLMEIIQFYNPHCYISIYQRSPA